MVELKASNRTSKDLMEQNAEYKESGISTNKLNMYLCPLKKNQNFKKYYLLLFFILLLSYKNRHQYNKLLIFSYLAPYYSTILDARCNSGPKSLPLSYHLSSLRAHLLFDFVTTSR
jgi:hypothetical protein